MEMLEELLLPITGGRLNNLFGQYSQYLSPEVIFDSPATALQAIESFFGLPITINGNNNPGISDIREYLLQNCTTIAHINGFRINAPHTHWGDMKPIIYKANLHNDTYTIGPHVIDNEALYLPVSFIFNKNYPLAFEWAEYDAILNIKEFKECMDIIKRINISISHKRYPLGISIDFFFKKSLFDDSISTVELPCDSSHADSNHFSYITRYTSFISQGSVIETEQVSWASNYFGHLELTPYEQNLFNELHKLIQQEPGQNGKVRFIAAVESKLKKRLE